MIRTLCVTLAGAVLTGCSVSGSSAPSMTTYGFAFAPPAFYEFCKREEALCATKGEEKAVDLTPKRRAELHAVNSLVNQQIKQKNDSPSGSGDVWRLPTDAGDCEDLAIEKKRRLMQLGWPASTLLLTVVRPRFSSSGHTVLTARTSQGDFVLDSFNPKVKLWSKTSYRYFARQSQDRQGGWEQIRKLT